MGRRLGDEDLYQIGRFNGMSRFVGSLVTEIKKKEAQTGQSHWNDPSVGTGYRQTSSLGIPINFKRLQSF